MKKNTNNLFSRTVAKTVFSLLFYSLALLWPSHPLHSQDIFAEKKVEEVPCAPLIGNVEGRKKQSLNGTWNALIDPNKVNAFNDLFQYAERNHKADPGELLELSVENGLTLQVPGDWNTQDDRLFFYNGKVWYKRDFDVNKKKDKRYFLHFGAINYKAMIYVNGEQVCTHKGGYTSFNCEITDQIKSGSNFVVINVNNTLTDSDIPTTSTDWMNYGGITRDVNLVELNNTFIQNYKLQLNPDNTRQVEGWAHCYPKVFEISHKISAVPYVRACKSGEGGK